MLEHYPGPSLNSQLACKGNSDMRNIRSSHLPFNMTPLGSWATAYELRRYDRAAVKLAHRTGLTLPVAQAVADLNGLGNRGRR